MKTCSDYMRNSKMAEKTKNTVSQKIKTKDGENDEQYNKKYLSNAA